MSTQQAESNVQSLIDLSIDATPHQMKGIGNGRQDVQCLLLETWKSLQECSDPMNSMELVIFVSIWGEMPNSCWVSWKTKFREIELGFWMYIWRHTSIMESLIFLCFFVFMGWQISKELSIGGIFQFVMSRLRKKHHLNVNVRKWGFMFAKCTVCESLKDLISKLWKNRNEVLEYEVKLRKHIFHQKSCRNLYHTWRIKLVQQRMSSYALFMTRWTMQKLCF